ncbi:hypothetical protein EV651_11387 [Kribbella sp. VKM Ac-2571]|uniref:hypothetical protein n=1 Tax=Kribbella sp. VKM Ac-2571 TaxID=2512222 RepID=UPI00105CF043|nr:hypothetical protein [Kribbella sp. VKM Ac-2571]TDO56062.1 hypothetical protein EV651_11387 [Kribbella sp. VKM Ac-2571]
MRGWILTLAATTVATAIAIAVNLATDGRHHPWAWIATVVLTALGGALSEWQRRRDVRKAEGLTPPSDPRPTPPHVIQTAVAGEGASVQQAAGDINNSTSS